MAKLELTTDELVAAIPSSLKDVKNAEGIANGISFDAELGIPLLPISIPIKIEFSEIDYDKQILLLEIGLNSSTAILQKGFETIIKSLPNLLPEDKLPAGVVLDGNMFYVSIPKLLYKSDYHITVTNLNIELGKLTVVFDIKSKE